MLIGYGLAGAAFHAPLIDAVDDLELSAVVTTDSERRSQVQQRHPGARLLDSPDAIWAASEDYDLVVVAAVNRVHVPLGLAAVAAGLPVVIDKPLATSAADARRLAAAAAERGVPVVPFHNRRWDGDFLTVQRLVDEGTLGRVLRFESRFERWRPQPRAGAWRERAGAEEGGGLLFDLGAHVIDQALLLFGRPRRVYAEVLRRRAGVEVDDDTFVALEHDGDVRSHLWVGALAAQKGPRLRVLGDRAAYVSWELDAQEAALRAGRGPGHPDWGRAPAPAWGRLGSDEDAREIEPERGAYERFYAGVVATVRAGAPPPVALDDAIAGLDVIEAAFASARRAAVVELGQSG